IGDLPTRFKYRKVEAETFGLAPTEILDADDVDLNELISLKKIAPFRRPDLVSRDREKWSKNRKKRLREFRKKLAAAKVPHAQPEPASAKKGGKRKREVEEVEGGEAAEAVAEGGEGVVGKKKKKKKKSAEVDTDPTDLSQPEEPVPVTEKKKKKREAHDGQQHRSRGHDAKTPGRKAPKGMSADRLASYTLPTKNKK
ncbi:KRI1-like family C-terminal-domain-containing protein, partial [Blyttiomyces helicus]